MCFYHFHQSDHASSYASSVLGRIAFIRFQLVQKFQVSVLQLSTIVRWNIGPLLLTELPELGQPFHRQTKTSYGTL